jgi:uncharacterized membrane protein HdeD (DUF308 family)
LEKIKKGEIKMKPKWYFILGSILMLLGLVALTITVIFIFNFAFFLFYRHYGPMYQYRLNLILANFPWWIVLIGILGLLLGIKFLKEYDFSYKKNFVWIIVSYIFIIFVSAYLINYFNLNKFFYSQGLKRRFYEKNHQIFKNKNFKGPQYLKQNKW